MDSKADEPWQDQLYGCLRRHDVTQFCYVPDYGHSILIGRAIEDRDVDAVALTTEEEGVAMVVGAELGGARAVLLTQGSGVGNCINFFPMVSCLRSPLLMLVTMRGEYGDHNPWQYGMGQAVETVLKAVGVVCLRVDRDDEVVPTVEAAIKMAFGALQPVAVILSQKLIGAKKKS